MKIPSDFVELLAAFESERVEYLVVGGYAMAGHGKPRFTKDLNVFLGASAENRARAEKALRMFGAPASTVKAIQSLSGLDVAYMGHPPMRIDLMVEIPGVTFDDAFQHRTRVVWMGQEVSLISKEHLKAAKTASGRAQDLVDAAEL